MWVIKLGGSLIGSPALARWLDVIAHHAHGQVIIVPGGGLFADAVRDTQQKTGINDATAHTLALHAMDQFGRVLLGMHPAFVTASSELEIAERSWQHRPMICLLSQMAQSDERIPKNWQVTSDSLSLWLAHKIGASGLLVVKSSLPPRELTSTAYSPLALTKAGYLDAAFIDFFQRKSVNSALEVRICDQHAYNDFQVALAQGRLAHVGAAIQH